MTTEAGDSLPHLAVMARTPVTIAAALLCWTGRAPSGVVPASAAPLGLGILGVVGYLLATGLLGMEEPCILVRIAAGRPFRGRLTGGAQ